MNNQTLFLDTKNTPYNCQFLQLISSFFFFLLICATIFGNLLVIVAIIRYRHLRRTGNYLICSLALTDLIVGLVLMPLKAFNEVVNFGSWKYGRNLCLGWLFIAILCSTASSFHLLFIAIDRYLAINRSHLSAKKPRNTQINSSISLTKNHTFQVILMIIFSWSISFCIALLPLTVWIDEEAFEERLREQICFPAQKVIHKLASQVVVFYGPIAIMIPLYVNIYQKSKRQCCPHLPTSTVTEELKQRKNSVLSNEQNLPQLTLISSANKANQHHQRYYRREYRVAKTLLTVLLAYIIFLWPFYLTTIITSILGVHSPPRLIYSLALWFLYSNSLVNPLIYAALNRYFARAFRQLLHI